MAKFSSFPPRFAFLADLTKDRLFQYRSATWLKSDFAAPVWTCEFDDRTFTVDFRIRIDDSTLLTAPTNEKLLESFKYWLCIQTHPDVTGPRVMSGVTSYYRIILTLAVIDYFLLNASKFELSRFGLVALTSGHIREMLIAFSSAPSVPYSVYQWDKRLAAYLENMGATLSAETLEGVLLDAPWIAKIETNVDRILDLTDDQLIKARAFLWKEGMYSRYLRPERRYRYHPNSRRLSEIIFHDTLWGKKTREIPEELCLIQISHYQRERRGIPVKSWEDIPTDSNFSRYVSILRSLGLLATIDISVPHTALKVASDEAFLRSLSLRETKRVRTLPHHVVANSLRSALEFSLEFGDDLVTSYLNVVQAAFNAKLLSLTYFDEKYGIREFITPSIRRLGVKHWGLEHHMLCVEHGNTSAAPHLRPPASEFFSRYRMNEGLYELLTVLYGAIQVCVGAVMARRQGEINELMADEALDTSKRYLIFRNRKTGVAGRRQKIARPIPEVAARLIEMLHRLQKGLIEMGAIKQFGRLFAMPYAGNIGLRSTVPYQDTLDRFCDYFEVETNSDGDRYYIRQHQLRRYFAMMFFWGSSFGGVETLQWFLGHTDPEHLYRYVTESIPGAALTSVKAAYAADLLIKENNEAAALTGLVARHFGTTEFSVLDYQELEEYIQDLLNDEFITIEPHFYSSEDGQRYRVLVTLKERFD